jgi:outer membrane protein assembly factor BamD (BamD/ComL family)
MLPSFYLLLFIALIIICVVILIIYRFKKKIHSELFSQGLYNENEGHYNLALKNYEDALSELRKLKVNNELDKKITQKIKILQTTIEYEKNFQPRIES